MKVRINARRWDDPADFDVAEVTFRDAPSRPGYVTIELDGEASAHPIELNPEVGETVEILRSDRT